jgi:hypothetical protein
MRQHTDLLFFVVLKIRTASTALRKKIYQPLSSLKINNLSLYSDLAGHVDPKRNIAVNLCKEKNTAQWLKTQSTLAGIVFKSSYISGHQTFINATSGVIKSFSDEETFIPTEFSCIFDYTF